MNFIVMDPFTALTLSGEALSKIPEDCKEYSNNDFRGPSIDGASTSERSMIYSCNEGDTSNKVCMRCPLLRGREISI